MSKKILIIEDEEKLARFVELELTHEGYEVSKAYDGRSGLELFETRSFDLVLLDVMLPGLSGIEVLRRIRKNSEIPVIMLTARDAVMDKVAGLDSGADDYVTKPFEIEELMARIRVLLRKSLDLVQLANTNRQALTWGLLTLDVERHSVIYDGNDIELTKKEFDLLHILLENKDIVLGRDTLIERVWGYDYIGESKVVDVYIRFLRSKIDDIFGVKIIHTIRGVGYVVKDDQKNNVK